MTPDAAVLLCNQFLRIEYDERVDRVHDVRASQYQPRDLMKYLKQIEPKAPRKPHGR